MSFMNGEERRGDEMKGGVECQECVSSDMITDR